MTSIVLSGLSANGFGSGALKLAGGVIASLTEVEAVSETSVDDLITETLLVFDRFGL